VSRKNILVSVDIAEFADRDVAILVLWVVVPVMLRRPGRKDDA